MKEQKKKDFIKVIDTCIEVAEDRMNISVNAENYRDASEKQVRKDK